MFTMYAPLASWGDIAVGESRGSWDRPSRSSILGLLAAAIGIERAAQDAHDALDALVGIATRTDAVGTPMVDYHTTQVATERTAKEVRRSGRSVTRRTLLAAGAPETILSRRGYRQDALHTIGVWERPNAVDRRWSLVEIKAALMRPAFVLYAGRKANPLALPLAPQVTSAETLAEAFAARRVLDPTISRSFADRLRWTEPRAREVAHDRCEGFESGLETLRRETRRDSRPHRNRWQFEERTVEIGVAARGDGEVPT